MSKTSVKKAIAGFDAVELRQLVLDLYTRSKEAKELLDFYADPDIPKKLEEYKKLAFKEANRYTRHAHKPRMAKIKALVKKFERLEPGPEAVADLSVSVIFEFIGWATPSERLPDVTAEAIDKFFGDVLAYLDNHMLWDEWGPQIMKRVREMKTGMFSCNILKKLFTRRLEGRPA